MRGCDSPSKAWKGWGDGLSGYRKEVIRISETGLRMYADLGDEVSRSW